MHKRIENEPRPDSVRTEEDVVAVPELACRFVVQNAGDHRVVSNRGVGPFRSAFGDVNLVPRQPLAEPPDEVETAVNKRLPRIPRRCAHYSWSIRGLQAIKVDANDPPDTQMGEPFAHECADTSQPNDGDFRPCQRVLPSDAKEQGLPVVNVAHTYGGGLRRRIQMPNIRPDDGHLVEFRNTRFTPDLSCNGVLREHQCADWRLRDIQKRRKSAPVRSQVVLRKRNGLTATVRMNWEITKFFSHATVRNARDKLGLRRTIASRSGYEIDAIFGEDDIANEESCSAGRLHPSRKQRGGMLIPISGKEVLHQGIRVRLCHRDGIGHFEVIQSRIMQRLSAAVSWLGFQWFALRETKTAFPSYFPSFISRTG